MKTSCRGIRDLTSAYDKMVKLFMPESVAIVGASRKPGKIGYVILQNLLESGYKGRIYPVNPHADEILGVKCYPSLKELPEAPDVVIVAVPADKTISVAEEAGEKGAKFLVVITSGFSEVGNVELEKKLVETARKYGMRILGPNIFGIAYAPANLNATFGPPELLPGKIGFITQSGALGIALMGWTVTMGIGLSTIVSIGNMSDLDAIEISEFLAEDPNTAVITIYLEGLKEGRGKEFLEKMSMITKKKPVVIIKAGRSRRGQRAVASHTGSLAGADVVYDAAFRRAGVIRVDTIEELFDVARALAYSPPPLNDKLLIITNGGGAGVMATDATEKYGVELLEVPEDLKERFRKHMPWFGSPHNPVDITGQATDVEYSGSLMEALQDDRVGGVIILVCQTAVLDFKKLAEAILKVVKDAKEKGFSKPVLVSMIGGKEAMDAMMMLEKNHIPTFSIPERAVYAYSQLVKYYFKIRKGR